MTRPPMAHPRKSDMRRLIVELAVFVAGLVVIVAAMSLIEVRP